MAKFNLEHQLKSKCFFFGKKYTTVISLTNRQDMKYPMLIGKKFLQNRFLVDVSQKYIANTRSDA